MEEKRKIGVVTTTATAGLTISGALTVLVVYVLSLNGIDLPEHVSNALTVLLCAIGGLVGGWLVKPGTGKRRG